MPCRFASSEPQRSFPPQDSGSHVFSMHNIMALPLASAAAAASLPAAAVAAAWGAPPTRPPHAYHTPGLGSPATVPARGRVTVSLAVLLGLVVLLAGVPPHAAVTPGGLVSAGASASGTPAAIIEACRVAPPALSSGLSETAGAGRARQSDTHSPLPFQHNLTRACRRELISLTFTCSIEFACARRRQHGSVRGFTDDTTMTGTHSSLVQRGGVRT